MPALLEPNVTAAPMEIPPIATWLPQGKARWLEDGRRVESGAMPFGYILESPLVRLKAGWTYNFRLSLRFHGKGGITFGVVSSRNKWLLQRSVQGDGPAICSLVCNIKDDGEFKIVITNFREDGAYATTLGDLDFTHTAKKSIEVHIGETDTILPHWGPVKRWIHNVCKGSRRWNNFVSAMEMRLGREELLSLPQYMSLCPTGQCNALCAFCSVTTNRTGIVKKQLPFDKLGQFLAPVRRTILMFGLEGNGEPTLYDRFDDLVETLTRDGATLYLITNGDQLTFDQIDMLVGRQVSSINFSMNAATAETHRRVMKLKNFDVVVRNIKRLVSERSNSANPMVSVSFVVHHDNIHEVQQFLCFAEDELGVDRIYIRPLSEIANDRGAVEDFRDLVPYEGEVRDMLDGIHEFYSDRQRKADVQLNPDSFRAVRPDPIDRILAPLGSEGRLLAPRRGNWTSENPALKTAWHLNRLSLKCGVSAPGMLLQSDPIPVAPGTVLEFSCDVLRTASPLSISVRDLNGVELSACGVRADAGRQKAVLSVQTGDNTFVQMALSSGGGNVDAEIDLGRLWTPGSGIRKEFKLPHGRRWQIDSPGAQAAWNGNVLNLQWRDKPGPYLVKSYSTQCLPETVIRLPIKLNVRSGRICIGVLSEDFQRWTHQFRFGAGAHEPVLEIKTERNQRLQIVLFSCDPEPLDAEIDWQDTLETPPTRRLDTARPDDAAAREKAPVVAETAAPAAAPTGGGKSVPESAPQAPAGGAEPGFFERLAFGRQKYYCQKPWTDLHNFSVDGRMDVCCIATGPSQQKYALGNVTTDGFQQIWNGETAKEFRRTVNGKTPLPPCARCPMALAYQGVLFDPQNTMNGVKRAVESKLYRLPGGNFLAKVVYFPLHVFMTTVLFRGFKRTK